VKRQSSNKDIERNSSADRQNAHAVKTCKKRPSVKCSKGAVRENTEENAALGLRDERREKGIARSLEIVRTGKKKIRERR
jgi:hypothetical protein